MKGRVFSAVGLAADCPDPILPVTAPVLLRDLWSLLDQEMDTAKDVWKCNDSSVAPPAKIVALDRVLARNGLRRVTEYRFTGSDCGFDSNRYLLQRMNYHSHGTNVMRQIAVNQMSSEFCSRSSDTILFLNHAGQQMNYKQPNAGWDTFEMNNITMGTTAWSRWLQILCKYPGGAYADATVLTNLCTALRIRLRIWDYVNRTCQAIH